MFIIMHEKWNVNFHGHFLLYYLKNINFQVSYRNLQTVHNRERGETEKKIEFVWGCLMHHYHITWQKWRREH
jgi:hypothetical protein